MSTDVGAVVVTYFPDATLEQRLDAIAAEVGRLVIVDNSATPEVRARLERYCAGGRAQFLPQAANTGLGHALNQGCAALAARGLTWAVAFDQDSQPEPGFVAALLGAAATADCAPAVVGANWRDAARPELPARHLCAGSFPGLFRRMVPAEDLADVTCVIASGSLFHLPTWRELGGFDAGLFLDLVDTDYCLRARAAGLEVRVAAGARLLHHRGSKRRVSLAGVTFWPAFAPASRIYYQFRNRLLLAPREVFRTPHWLAFEAIYAAKVLAEILGLEGAKAAKLGAALLGTWHGLLGRRGPQP